MQTITQFQGLLFSKIEANFAEFVYKVGKEAEELFNASTGYGQDVSIKYTTKLEATICEFSTEDVDKLWLIEVTHVKDGCIHSRSLVIKDGEAARTIFGFISSEMVELDQRRDESGSFIYR